MEKLIKKYNDECNLTSKLANRLWKIGQIILLSIFIIYYAQQKNFLISFLILLIFIIVLYFICSYIEIRNISNKLNINKMSFMHIIFNKEDRKDIYKQFDIFQKKWITNYCKKNKINSIEKLKLLREELRQKQNNNIIKYIDPIVIGTLLLTVWEVLVQRMSEKIGTVSAVLICIFLAIIISIIIGWFKKEWQEQKEFMSMFNKFSGITRLNNLLLYRILKSNK